MTLPDTGYLQFTPDLRICRILNGMWQVSGAHGAINPADALHDMMAYHDAGFSTWDLADHYGPAEDFVGAFRKHMAEQRGPEILTQIQAFTKWVPRPGPVTRKQVVQAVDTSLRRMGVSALDLMQFHWWEYGDTGYITALNYLGELRDEGRIRHLALTNFDTERLSAITEKGIRIVSNQVQYSLIDRRPEVQMSAYCKERGIWLLPYGALCGGFLSERYLGQPEPRAYALGTASLQKYKRMIDAWGGWALFQALLQVLKQIADKHQATIAAVAVRYVLDKPMVAGVIVGARLGLAEHRRDSQRVFDLTLDAADYEIINGVLEQACDLFKIIGDCGDEYRG